MRAKYYLHDDKSTEQVKQIMEELNMDQNNDLLLEKIYMSIHQNEVEIVYDIDKAGNCKPLYIKLANNKKFFPKSK